MREAGQAKKPTSERRKQQNRQAQKNYRERQTRKLKTLEALIESREVSLGNHAAIQGTSPSDFSSVAPYTPESLVTSEDGSRVPITSLPATRREDRVTGPFALTEDGLPISLSNEALSVQSELKSGSESVSSLPSRTEWGSLLDENDQQIIASRGLNIQEVLKAGIQALSKHSAPQTRPLALSQAPDEEERVARDPAIRTDKIYLIDNTTTAPSDYIPDIHANSIRVKQLCTVAAIRHNSEMLGVTFEQVIDLEMVSSFHTATLATADGGSPFARTYEHLNRDLRPTPAQLKYEHSAWIDTMPFPTVRQRLIECINAEPPVVDEDEFCQDLDRDGLICWGTMGSKTDRPVGSGAPWDVRSWEAQPWFLRKWWFLIGGKDGELFQASKWWREMRGGTLPYAWR